VRRRSGLTLALLLAACPLAFSACGDTVQSQPVSHHDLERLLASPYPVYWLGFRFSGRAITEASKDASGSFTVQYGVCVQGGQGTCTPAVRVITSPDNSFLPGGATATHPVAVRGLQGVAAQEGRTISIATAGVVVDIYAQSAALAEAAAQTMVPINQVASPGGPLPKRRPDTGFDRTPLPSQVPSPVKPLG
jgi:hypothetical protein